MVVTNYTINAQNISKDYSFAVLSDLHDKPYREAIELVKHMRPDAIFVVGDLVDRHLKRKDRCLPFLTECVEIAPTFFSYGNHEIKFPVISEEELLSTGVTVLDNSWTLFNNDILIGGQRPSINEPKTEWLRDFEDADQFKILLDHHPEHYPKYLRDYHPEIDLIISGHAHGGQIRLFGHGLFSPGQGIFPKYTKGFYDERLIVGAGLSNTGYIIPRVSNPREVLEISIKK